ncbi:MAG TPA: insulinase family protein, partial [Thermoanaerobaculia bacterium]|nr:insulinase family protein [Thermoanaerobaculia bacterium]
PAPTAVWISNPPAAWLTDLHGALKRLLYRRHPYRLPDIGRPESLRALTADDVEACHRQRCVGSNTVVVVSGRVSPAALRAPLARLFSAVAAGAFAPESPEEEGVLEPDLRVEPRAWNIGALAAGYRGVAWEPRLWCALELLRTLLVGPENNSVRGRLVRAMRDAGTAYSVHCYNQAGLKEGYFSIMTAYLPEREAEARAIVAREIERLAAGEVAPPELAHGRKLALLQHLRLYESPRQHACAAGRHLLFAPSAAAPWSGVASALEEITVDEIAAAARKTFRETARGLVLFRTSGE